ncbi:SDR family oxidoreductase [Bogoriella caseilytica]|uniref:Uncharacterized protein YbjT (DUF2867 family) n=1 Tax=Bogoriella caseilytica TaxID=56055 RepID=A0A3N2BF28_9MICO|nr:NAD(P)H-binding protein [Bogoriella caseilytica]ROR73852.1 uncharacterized protein YbjT (DUF2867 family) [Bogoriella caseilytica]
MSAERVLITGATGLLGREVVAALGRRGVRPRVLLRSAERRSALPADADVEVAVGDLGDHASLGEALAGVDAAFLVTPHDSAEEHLGLTFLSACEAAGVSRLVLSTAIHPDSGIKPIRNAIYALMGRAGPHYVPKYRVEAAVRDSAVDSVVLLPANFYQNDELWRPEILSGSYPQPIGKKGTVRVDCRDVGEAAARGLLRELDPGVFPMVGPEPRITGPGAAELWQAALGREVSYVGDELRTWEQAIGERMAPAMREDFRRTYELIQRFAPRGSAGQRARTTAALGRPPTSYADYAHDAAARWSDSAQ